jgi:fatty-acid peroxygenase
MVAIPTQKTLDDTAALLTEGYRYLGRRFERAKADTFETRLMGGRKAVCVVGEDAARMFYAPDRFTRRGALPPTTLLQLQDRGSVQTLDGDAHRRRKRLFLSLVGKERVAALADAFEAEWRAALPRWEGQERVVLFKEVRLLITRAVCAWAGAPLDDEAAHARAREFGAMIDGAGAVGPRAMRGMLLRSRTERWARKLIAETRSGERTAPEGSALQAIAAYEEDGRPLDLKTAGVEFLNVLRPTVAVDRFIAFAALALHEHPAAREAAASGDPTRLEALVREVRRFYPFFPAVGGKALEAFEWRGRRFRKGAWVLLALYDTNHDPRIWREPQSFRPERFLERETGQYGFVPQGGGDPAVTHRCPGEGVTEALMARAVALLTTAMRYDLPPQDLSIDLGRLPTAPRSGVVLKNVRLL